MSITIKKIAKDLNLAVSTVSKALRDSYEISEDTKRLVLDYAAKMEYNPNPYAGSLKNRRTSNIAVVLPEVADTFFSNAISGIENVAQEMGYHVMVYQTHESCDKELSILRELRNGRVDGILISVSGHIDTDCPAHSELSQKIPLIYFDRACEGVHAGRVLTNDFEASYRAAAHLIAHGCRELLFLASGGHLSIVNQRRDGFLKALSENGLTIDEKTVLKCGFDESENDLLIEKAITGKNVDGVVASVEKLAMQLYFACHRVGMRIPQDIKVVAFSNLPIAELLAPPLSTVVQPAFEMGQAAATLLFKALEKKVDVADQRITLPSVIIERESSR